MKNIFLMAAFIMLASFTTSKATSNDEVVKKPLSEILVENNPMTSKLSISVPCHVKILNAENEKVIERKNCDMVDISHLEIGDYNVVLSDEEGRLLKQVKLIVE